MKKLKKYNEGFGNSFKTPQSGNYSTESGYFADFVREGLKQCDNCNVLDPEGPYDEHIVEGSFKYMTKSDKYETTDFRINIMELLGIENKDKYE